jgi:N-hydroxyarylamine O-acetyltransferase
MDLDAYFQRIGYSGPREPTRDVLWAVAHAQALAIPFENIGVLANGAPDLELAAVERKLVAQRRGGYCFELNALLQGALTHLGFESEGLGARVRYGVPPAQPTMRSHMVLRVRLGDAYMLADAGFGGLTLTAPLWMRMHEEQPTPHETVRLAPLEGDHLLQARVAGTWRDVYRFDLVPQWPIDYVQQNYCTATRPGALFAGNLVVARPDAAGRTTLFNRTLTRRTLDGEAVRRTLESADDLQAVLEERFGIELPAATLAIAWEVSGRGAPSSSIFD